MSSLTLTRLATCAAVLAAGAMLAGCGDDGDTHILAGSTPATTPASTIVERSNALPGVVFEVTGVAPGSGPGGNLQAGDTVSVTFTLLRDDGTALPLAEMDGAVIILSGPTDNYQRVLPQKSDVKTQAVENQDGSYTYTFADPLPAVYAAPINDTADFGLEDGELQGEPLRDGTYTVAVQGHKNYTVDGETFRDSGVGLEDLLFGSATTITTREVVKNDNCNQCHVEVRAHSKSNRLDVRYCVLCHTAGAEDNNNPTLAGGTPGVTIDFRAMIHKIHNGSHLPSVLGVSSNSDGTRKYDTATAVPYLIAGGSSVHDFSATSFPVMPSAYVAYTYTKTGVYDGPGGNGPMPRDPGYSALSQANKLTADKIRSGNVSCAKCHGDPDGAGPITAPAQGDLIFAQPTRNACGSCHDDIDWTKPYQVNSPGFAMPPQADDTTCKTCHAPSTLEAKHLHPWSNPAINTGVNVVITDIIDENGDSTTDNLVAGDPIGCKFTVKNDAGADIPLHTLTRFQLIASGPTTNPQLILPNVSLFDFTKFRAAAANTGKGTISSVAIAAGATKQTLAVVFTSPTEYSVVGSSGTPPPLLGETTFGSPVDYGGVTFTVNQGTPAFVANDRFYLEVVPPASSYTTFVPLAVSWELLGDATGALQDLPAANTPIWWGRQTVYEVDTIVGGATSLGADAPALQAFVVVDKTALGGLTSKLRLHDTDSGAEEYLELARWQTTDDKTGADLGTQDRLWFKSALRYAYRAATTTVEIVTLVTKREGTHYEVLADANGVIGGDGVIRLLAGGFTAGKPVLVSYSTHGRFGWKAAPGGPLLDVYPQAAADSEDIDLSWGDWKGLALLSGTYTIGAWANLDFTVAPGGTVVPTEAWDKLPVTDNTTYRMISPPATKQFLFGTATTLTGPREVISDYEACNKCHGDLQAHGFGRRGLETCLLCHTITGTEDGPLTSYSGWAGIGATAGATMDFRTLLHKVHMGKELTEPYEVNGVFLKRPYAVTYDEVVFPAMPGEAANCTVCHGENNDAWLAPQSRNHPSQSSPTRTWRAVCTSCHDSPAAAAHADVQTSASMGESCAVCHGPGATEDVEVVHKPR